MSLLLQIGINSVLIGSLAAIIDCGADWHEVEQVSKLLLEEQQPDRADSGEVPDGKSPRANGTASLVPMEEDERTEAELETGEPIPASSSDRVIAGAIMNQRGDPVRDAFIVLPLRYVGRETVLGADGKADQAGRFKLRVPAELTARGTHSPLFTMWVHAPGYQIATANVSAQLFHGSAESLSLIMRPEAQTSVVVRDPAGDPLRDALVRPHSMKVTPPDAVSANYMTLPPALGARVSRRTDQNGRARLPFVDRERLRRVSIASDDYGLQIVEWKDGIDVPLERDIKLRPVVTLHGRIRADDPSFVSGRQISIYGRDAFAPSAAATIGPSGEFVFEKIPVCRASLHISLPPELPYRVRLASEVEVSAQRSEPLEFDLERAVRVIGKVQFQSTGEPVADTLVSVRSTDAALSESLLTDQAGEFSTFMLPGTVRRQAIWLPEGVVGVGTEWQEEIWVPAVKAFKLPPIEVAPGEMVRGVLLDARSNPAANVQVYARVGDRRYHSDVTDEDGRFRHQLPQGKQAEYLCNLGWNEATRQQEWESLPVLFREPLILRLPYSD